jgi:hypothetical protein
VLNRNHLAKLGLLEVLWMETYIQALHLNDVPLDDLQAVFDACNKDALQQEYPIQTQFVDFRGSLFSLFRGCAGPEHRMGMSWSPSLSKAIWYAAHHATYYKLSNVAIYAAIVEPTEIYCCGNIRDYDFIVRPKEWWQVSVPASEFRIDRSR